MRWALLALLMLESTTARAGEVERLYVIDCGFAHAEDQSLWSPGVNVGVQSTFPTTAILYATALQGTCYGTPASPIGSRLCRKGRRFHRFGRLGTASKRP